MKFSYSLLKKLVPGLPSKNKVIEEFNLRALEVEESTNTSITFKFTPNRYDMASQWGIAREASAIFKLSNKIPKLPKEKPFSHRKLFSVAVKNDELCPRYMGRVFEIADIGVSPKWMQDVLKDAGMRPINALVDIMNYVMLEVGQPMHAFDFDAVAKDASGMPRLIVRTAHTGEKMTTLDGKSLELAESMLVIADEEGPLALAGIKGGNRAEVTKKTKKIIVEAANFDYVSVQKTSLALRLSTDASVRFAHNLSPHLTAHGMIRATQLLKEILDAKLIDAVDAHAALPGKKVLPFYIARCNRIMGAELSGKEMIAILKRIGFEILPSKKQDIDFLVGVPELRMDINIFEDLVEEVVRLYGYENIAATAPLVGLGTPEIDAAAEASRLIKSLFVSFGFDEVYNHSFADKAEQLNVVKNTMVDAVAVANPIAEDKGYMRANLMEELKKNVAHNKKYFADVRLFEVGNVFMAGGESLSAGCIISLAKKHEAFLELRGVVEDLIARLGVTDVDSALVGDDMLRIEADGKTVGHIMMIDAHAACAEFSVNELADMLSEERAYRPLPKYPAITRDISALFATSVRVAHILALIDRSSVEYVEDIDLIDYFEDEKALGVGKRSMTFRVVFRANDRTLTDAEVDGEMQKLTKLFIEELKAEIR